MLLLTILFIILSAFAGALLGLLMARLFIRKSEGFGAIGQALGFGMIGLIIGVVVAFLLRNQLDPAQIRTTLFILGGFDLLVIGWVLFQVNKNRRNSEQGPPPPRKE